MYLKLKKNKFTQYLLTLWSSLSNSWLLIPFTRKICTCHWWWDCELRLLRKLSILLNLKPLKIAACLRSTELTELRRLIQTIVWLLLYIFILLLAAHHFIVCSLSARSFVRCFTGIYNIFTSEVAKVWWRQLALNLQAKLYKILTTLVRC